jgi:hypothetical protein
LVFRWWVGPQRDTLFGADRVAAGQKLFGADEGIRTRDPHLGKVPGAAVQTCDNRPIHFVSRRFHSRATPSFRVTSRSLTGPRRDPSYAWASDLRPAKSKDSRRWFPPRYGTDPNKERTPIKGLPGGSPRRTERTPIKMDSPVAPPRYGTDGRPRPSSGDSPEHQFAAMSSPSPPPRLAVDHLAARLRQRVGSH